MWHSPGQFLLTARYPKCGLDESTERKCPCQFPPPTMKRCRKSRIPFILFSHARSWNQAGLAKWPHVLLIKGDSLKIDEKGTKKRFCARAEETRPKRDMKGQRSIRLPRNEVTIQFRQQIADCPDLLQVELDKKRSLKTGNIVFL